MRSVVLVALTAAIGNMLQGWDNATIAGAVIYIKKEFHLEKEPKIEGLIVAMSLIGATMITTFSGPVSDRVGRRSMLILSSLLYFLSSIVMFWSPNVYVLLFARLLDGFGIGLAVTLVPIYISETAPSEIRGLLNTFPQFCGSGGMFLSYCLVFGMSLQESPSWRLMLGVLSIPSILYFVLAAFFLPESPRWLVSKGRMEEARQVLQRLRDREDVSGPEPPGELALLVEGLGVGKDTLIEEYVIGPDDDEETETGQELPRKDQIKLYGPEDGQSWMAKPVKGQSSLALASRHGSMLTRGGSMMDPVVTLFGSIHEKLPSENMNASSSRSMVFPNMGSILGLMGRQESQWDPERNNDDSSDQDESLNSPLLSPQATETDEFNQLPAGTMHRRQSSLFMANMGEKATATSIGGGWQLAWKYNEKVGADGKRVNGGLQRMYIHEETSNNNNAKNMGFSRRGSLLSFQTEADVPAQQNGYVQASALVSQASMIPGIKGETAMLPQEIKAGPDWRELKEPGVKRALIVGVGIQILQQFAGINGVMYYTPQILEETGVSSLLTNLGISEESASLLISSLTTLFMLPCILVSMRSLMLSTIPILILSLITLVIGSLVKLEGTANALISTASVMVYLSCFVMGFGAIPNILCSEIFPTSVRGLCITICALTFWICDIIVTYTLPVMLKSLGLAGVFGIYAFVCAVAWVFVYLKVPETKGMPLEVISEFFSVGAKHQDASASFLSDDD
ncbi:hypothetical protein Bca4012_088830 [Brassica carinata]